VKTKKLRYAGHLARKHTKWKYNFGEKICCRTGTQTTEEKMGIILSQGNRLSVRKGS